MERIFPFSLAGRCCEMNKIQRLPRVPIAYEINENKELKLIYDNNNSQDQNCNVLKEDGYESKELNGNKEIDYVLFLGDGAHAFVRDKEGKQYGKLKYEELDLSHLPLVLSPRIAFEFTLIKKEGLELFEESAGSEKYILIHGPQNVLEMEAGLVKLDQASLERDKKRKSERKEKETGALLSCTSWAAGCLDKENRNTDDEHQRKKDDSENSHRDDGHERKKDDNENSQRDDGHERKKDDNVLVSSRTDPHTKKVEEKIKFTSAQRSLIVHSILTHVTTKDILETLDPEYREPVSDSNSNLESLPSKRKPVSDPEYLESVSDSITSRRSQQTKKKTMLTSCVGFRQLLNNGTYKAAYPLHLSNAPYVYLGKGKEQKAVDTENNHGQDSDDQKEEELVTRENNHGQDSDDQKEEEIVTRELLYDIWGRPSNLFKTQPRTKIRDYFGEKIAFYFAWLGFYTTMLQYAAVVGLVCFLYGVATMMDNVISQEICDSRKAGNLTMCPQCDQRCSYWHLGESCEKTFVTYLFDNPATVFFACFMSLWACIFHELWKREEVTLQVKWGVRNFEEDELIRPEFEGLLDKKRTGIIKQKNIVTGNKEPYVVVWNRCMRYTSSVSVLIFFLFIVCGALFGVIVYRTIIVTQFHVSEYFHTRADTLTSGTSALINLVIMQILSRVYEIIARRLTEWEFHRTETEWEDAYIFKKFLFEFINYYASIFYIAFFKGRFIGRPGNYDYNLFGHRQEECQPAGCLTDLCIQLGIIMVGKQFFGNVQEVLKPLLKSWYTACTAKVDNGDRCCLGCCPCVCPCNQNDKDEPAWARDFKLNEPPQHGPFEEYLEMVLQFGFVTIFVAAFPLAPLFALINNMLEIRVDAYKLTRTQRRPPAKRAQDIGIWYGILRGISAVAVISNAGIIAFTSEFIPRMVYKYVYSPDRTLSGFFQNFTLAEFNTTGFKNGTVLEREEFENVEICRYRDFREPPGSPNEYEYTIQHWHVMAARLAFILVFENMIVFLTWLIMYLIPDIPHSVKIKILQAKARERDNMKHHQKTHENQQKTPKNQQKMPENQQKTPENQQKTPENQQKTPENQQKMPEHQQKMPENQQKMPENQQQMPENQQQMSENQSVHL